MDKYNMKNLNTVAEDLFSKIRGRFSNVTIGDADGNITLDPEQARFFEFSYVKNNEKLGKITVSLDEDNGVVVMHDSAIAEYQHAKSDWFKFLKEIRRFAKKRLLNFNTRDINKSNLEKKDYQYLATRAGDNNMNESKLYGTGFISYQKVDEARIVIKHNEAVDPEIPTSRTRNIKSIYIENAEGERFKYPYRHLSGARAMARHVAEGGKPYDDFGSHITELSEEMWKLRKFKNYVGRSAVMAESLEGYMDIVKERVTTIKKTIESLQKPNRYHEAVDSFEKPIFEEIPEDVKENWIDQLTIRQFNEELKDVFPYIYRLVGENTRAKELGPEDLVSEDDDPCWKNYKQVGMKKKGGKQVPNCVPKESQIPEKWKKSPGDYGEPYEIATAGDPDSRANTKVNKKAYDLDKASKSKKKVSLKKAPWEESIEEHFESLMGQFSEATVEHGRLYVKFRAKNSLERDEKNNPVKYLTGFADFAQDPDQVKEKTALRKFTALNNMKDIANAIKKLMTDKVFVSAKKIILYRDSAGLENKFSHLAEFYDWVEGYQGDKIAIEEPEDDPDKPEREKGVGKKRKPKGYYAANPKDYDIPDKKMTRYFSIDNDRLLTFLKKQMPDFMNKHYRANMGMFMMNDKDYQQFRKFLQSSKVVDNYGTTSIEVDKERSFAEDIHSESTEVCKECGNPSWRLFSEAEKQKGLDGKACWKGYRRQGTKMKGGKRVDNCVKVGEDDTDEGNAFAHAVRQAKMNGKKKGDKIKGPDGDEIKLEKEQKTPISEFILSYFDKNTGQFPKGETAVLTMIEKDYGEQFIEPAKAFIERVNERVSEVMGYREEPEVQEDDFDEGYKELPPIDREKYQERSGLEGPFSTLSGKVVYYDPKEGSYYDPDTDMYISYDDFRELDKDYSNMKDDIEFDRVRKLAGL